MGNESSRLKGLIIEKHAVDANDFWSLYNAESPSTSTVDGRQLLSIFQGEPVNGQLWVSQGPLERAIRNLMIYRHPYILRYISTWEQGGQKYLATERVRPLSATLSNQSDLQICLGLRTILCSLIFLTEKALARHLNICSSSIYVTDDGHWRLGGFEYVWKTKEVTKTLLDLANSFRYKPAIDADETKSNDLEQFAFATLCEELLVKCTAKTIDTATPYASVFREYCTTHLKHANTQMRPRLSAVLLHPYFNHEFVLIHSFLFELPLKSIQEKQDFFSGLIDRLRYFDPDVVGAQLSADLLSRMVLLDPTAQLCVTPYVLKTKADHAAALFPPTTYVQHVWPHIRKMFRIRDAQIRLILLEYFMEFVRLLSIEDLREFVLPHLQEGMHDTNEVLVAKTMRCLADLIPILGAETVLGGSRARLFSDGRPQAALSDTATAHWVEPRSITPVMGGIDYLLSSSPLQTDVVDNLSNTSFTSLNDGHASLVEMPLRLSPDGGEDEKNEIVTDVLNEDDEQQMEIEAENVPRLPSTGLLTDDEEVWSDWETDELQRLSGVETNTITSKIAAKATISDNTNLSPTVSTTPPTKINDDLSEFDIKVQVSANASGAQFDFFADMTPIIISPQRFHIDNEEFSNKNCKTKTDEIFIDGSRFAAVPLESNDTTEAFGWGVDIGDHIWSE